MECARQEAVADLHDDHFKGQGLCHRVTIHNARTHGH